MKIPTKPPQLADLMAGDTGRFIGLAGQSDAIATEDYLHWDELRHKPVPEGFTHETWWMALKIQRGATAKTIPGMASANGKPFKFSLPDQLLAALHNIDSRARGRVVLAAPVATKENRDHYIFNSLVEEAITSSQLEGASTTRQVAADMIRYQRKPRDPSEQMILNNYRAMQSIRDLAKQPLSYAMLMEIHRTLAANTLADAGQCGNIQQPGEQRVNVVDNRSNKILHTPPSAKLLPKMLEAMIGFANRDVNAKPFIHPVIHASILHFWLAYLHPFIDGNGRTARALFYWAMLRQGYWLFEFISISHVLKQAPAKYAKAFLYTETDGNDLTYFVLHQIQVIEKALAALEGYIQRKTQQSENVENLLKDTNLNYRQIALLSHAIRHPGHEYTINSHRTSHRIAYATARADLMRLSEIGLLDGTRRGSKTLVFIAPQDLQGRIQQSAA